MDKNVIIFYTYLCYQSINILLAQLIELVQVNWFLYNYIHHAFFAPTAVLLDSGVVQ